MLVLLLRKIQLPYRQYGAALIPAIAGSATMVAALFALNSHLPVAWPAALRLGVQVAFGGAVYFGILLTFFRDRVLRYLNFVKGLRKGKEVTDVAVS
jgi:hypothetical protein